MKIRIYTVILFILVAIISVAFVSSCIDQTSVEGKESTASRPESERSASSMDAQSSPRYRNLVDNEDISLADMEGKVLLIDFWATWCPPCREEIPGFVELYDKYKDQGFAIVGISVDKGEEVVKRFIQKQNMNYPVIMNTKELQSKYEKAMGQPIRGIPTTISVNREGEIESVHVGFRPKGVFEQEIQRLLQN